ncbi:GIY-YIG nuclease family protein [Alkaliphilus oremlandii]|uniref:GIY-YIG catalytic domain-containing protein n=1 Tax=Alkaliphilus oremlandii (strain OhILAs) TaxID=350688 RepID=A8MI98_ALKOO|nr:hypothetical protein [Alkaliphilus oremlandii]ABW19530.1 conserved hypothetical protein [Alkaliphilus oremlandii OhILAs]
MSELEEINQKLLEPDRFIPAEKIDEMTLPEETGIYCIKVIDMKNSGFEGEIQSIFLERNNPILYIGKSDKSTLKKRLCQELRAKEHGTFFRSLGTVLGYLPPKGSLKNTKRKSNYKFNKSDEVSIINWINKHLEVSWIQIPKDIGKIEKELIELRTPLFNIVNNPSRVQLLKDMRTYCREFANS